MIGWNAKTGWQESRVSSDTHYGDILITGASATCVSPDRKKWNIFDLWRPTAQGSDYLRWEARQLGEGHLVRLVDSCVRSGIVPDAKALRMTRKSPDQPHFWREFCESLLELHKQALITNAVFLDAGDFDRVYMRVLIRGQKKAIGPPRTSTLRVGTVELILEPLGEYAPPGSTILPATHLASGDYTAMIKTAANYPAYMAMQEDVCLTGRLLDVPVDDAFSVKVGLGGSLLVGEATTSTLGGLINVENKPTVFVPEHFGNNTLVGRTAAWSLQLAREQLNLPAVYMRVTLPMLFCATELWKMGNASYISPISRVGNLSCHSWQQAETGTALRDLLKKAMRGELYPEHSVQVNLDQILNKVELPIEVEPAFG